MDKIEINEETIRESLISSPLSNRIIFAYLLGSAGTPRFNSESDIDLAIYWREIPSLDEQFAVKGAIEERFCRELDWVTINNTDPIFARQLLETGRLLICNDLGFHLNWKTNELSRYPDFKFSRKIIEDNILIRKKHV